MVGTVLASLCQRAYPGLPASDLKASRRLAALSEVESFVEMLTTAPFLDAAYWLSSAYAICAGDVYRKSLAMFFTPPSLTSRLLDDLAANGVRFDEGKFCDPACGGAAFLAPIALRMKAQLGTKGLRGRKVLEHVANHIFGTDLDPTLCALSKHFLLMALREEVLATNGWTPEFQVKPGDSLTDLSKSYGAFDVIVCNSPFRKMTPNEVERYRSGFEDVIEGQPNLYGLFMELSVRLLKDKGVAALVTPTSFLSGQNFRKVRTFLMSNVDVLNIGMVSDRLGVFIDVQQETALTIVRRRQQTVAAASTATVSVVAADGHYVNVGKCSLPNSGATWPIPRTEGDVNMLSAAQLGHATLKDYGYRVRIGNFVWNRDTRPVYRSLADVLKSKSKTAVPLLWSSDIGADGSLNFRVDPKDRDEHRFVDFGDTHHRSVIRRPSVLMQRVTSNDQLRRLIVAAVPNALLAAYGGYVGENHTVIVEQVSDKPELPARKLALLLSSPTVDRYFRCISGATNVSAFELGQLALPDPATLKSLLRQGLSMNDAVKIAFFKRV